MDLELSSVAEDEFPAFCRAVEAAFGVHASDEEVARWRSVTELDRTVAVAEGAEIVGTAGAYSMELTLPGGVVAPAAGVTAVSVRATHRRRGILRRMMLRQLDDVAERGEAVAVLTASESAIYGRFGYGQASAYHSWTLATEATLLDHPPRPGGRVRLVGADEGTKALSAVFDRARLRRPGQVSVPDGWWRPELVDAERDRDGASAFFYAVHETEGGEADGVVAYRFRERWEHGLPASQVVVKANLYAVDDEVGDALWAFLMGIDLTRSIRAEAMPVDDAFRWRLADPRRLVVDHRGDHLWLRVVDLPAALEARRYLRETGLVVEVADPLRPGNDGRWSVETGPEGASVRRAAGEADIALGIGELGSLYLGGVSASELARAGRIEERRAGGLPRADALFAAERAPWCSIEF